MKAHEELIIDLRSGSIGALVIGSDEGKREVVLVTRRQLELQKDFEPGRLIAQVSSELKELMLEIKSRRHHFHPRKIHLVIGSPWYLSQTRSVTHKSDRPFEYDEKLAQKLFSDEESSFRIENFGEKKTETIEREVLSISLNGYPTQKPYGKQCNEISISFYLSMIDADFLTLLRKSIMSEFRSDLVVHTFPFLALSTATEVLDGKASSFILVDIGGEVSELSLVRSGTAIEGFSFPLGAHSIIRGLAVTFNTSLLEAASIYHAYLAKQVDSKVEGQITSLLADIKVKWTTYVHGMLDKISTSYILPPNVIVLSNPETALIFADVMADNDISKLFANQNPAIISIPDVDSIKLPISIKPGSGNIDIFLAVELSAIERLSNAS